MLKTWRSGKWSICNEWKWWPGIIFKHMEFLFTCVVGGLVVHTWSCVFRLLFEVLCTYLWNDRLIWSNIVLWCMHCTTVSLSYVTYKLSCVLYHWVFLVWLMCMMMWACDLWVVLIKFGLCLSLWLVMCMLFIFDCVYVCHVMTWGFIICINI